MKDNESFESSGFLNLYGKDLKTMLGYQSPHYCDRTIETDGLAVNKDTTIFVSTEQY